MPRVKKSLDVTPKPLSEVKAKATKKKTKEPELKTRNTYNEETTYKLSKMERETLIRISDDEEKWQCYSNIGKDINKMKKQGWTLLKEDYYRDGSICGAWFETPRRCVSFLNVRKREVSPEVKEKMRKRMTVPKVEPSE